VADIVTDPWEQGDPPDVIVNRVGPRFFVLDLHSIAARLWIQKNLPRPREWWCGSVIYRGLITKLADQMTHDGLLVR